MKKINNKINPNMIKKQRKELNTKSLNLINFEESYKGNKKPFSNLSQSTNFNTINNIRDSKIVKIKNIIKKNNKAIYNKKEKEKEKEPSDDDSSDYANPEDDDFENILRESMSILSLKTSNTNPFAKKESKTETPKLSENINKSINLEKMLYNKINEHFDNDNKYIDRYSHEEIKEENNDNQSNENFVAENQNSNKNKSINISDLINPENIEDIQNKEKNDLEQKDIYNTPKEEFDYNSLEQKNIFNNDTNIINLTTKNEIGTNYDINELIKPENNIENNNILNNPDNKNRLINHNISIDKKLKEIRFFERLKEISDSRFLFFKENYRKDNNFLDESTFENILISEKNLKTQSPLTLIFQKIFSPDKPQYPLKKNFFEKIFSSRENTDYKPNYDKKELNKVPKFFNDLNYVNNLFNSFDFDELNIFLEEIKQWQNTFNYEQEYTHPLKYFKKKKYINLYNNLIIYFISPCDLIVDYHSHSTGIPFSDTVMAINQFIFHNDIKYDTNKGRFQFKTSVKILNSIKMVKNTQINNAIREEGKNENDEEIINNVWTFMKKEILEQDLINQQNAEIIYQKYLENNLNKYNNYIPEEYNELKIKNNDDNEEVWDSFSENSGEDNT